MFGIKENKKTKLLIVANWKMNPNSLTEARKIFGNLKKSQLKTQKTRSVICPPTVFIGDLAGNYRVGKMIFGVQDISVAEDSKSTGENSIAMLKSLGVQYAIIGHSERRAIGETDEIISKKIKKSLENKITPILCVGEISRDENGKYLRSIEEQLHKSLSGISSKDAKQIVIAYEPVWAIGAGHHAVSPAEINHMSLFIKKTLAQIYDRKTAFAIKIIYGGSVDSVNCREIIHDGGVEGLLIGRASLDPVIFVNIVKELNK